MTVLFPGEKTRLRPVGPQRGKLRRGGAVEGLVWVTATTRLNRNGTRAIGVSRALRSALETDELARDRVCQRILKLSFFKAAVTLTGEIPWGALTGIRPARMLTRMMDQGHGRKEGSGGPVRGILCLPPIGQNCACPPPGPAAKPRRRCGRMNFPLYVGIPFCPTRCAYCSFVSASVEKNVCHDRAVSRSSVPRNRLDGQRSDGTGAEGQIPSTSAAARHHAVPRTAANPAAHSGAALRPCPACVNTR